MGNVRMRAEQINYGASNVKVALDDLDPKSLIALSGRMDAIEAWKATVKAEEKTGAEVTFTNALALDAVSLSAEIEASQDLHGYDHPWVGGAGLNKCNPDAVALVTSDTGTQRYGLVFDAAGTYTLSASVNLASGELDIRKFSNDTYIWIGALVTANVHNIFTETIESGEKLILFGSLSMDLNAVKSALTDAKVMVESGSTAHTYEPYSNICHISGRTSVTITQEGESA